MDPTTRERCSRDRESRSDVSDAFYAAIHFEVDTDCTRGKLADYMPGPYPNEEAARAGNGG
jgi:hypothetical protein